LREPEHSLAQAVSLRKNAHKRPSSGQSDQKRYRDIEESRCCEIKTERDSWGQDAESLEFITTSRPIKFDINCPFATDRDHAASQYRNIANPCPGYRFSVDSQGEGRHSSPPASMARATSRADANYSGAQDCCLTPLTIL
jgi:hypothetical protein